MVLDAITAVIVLGLDISNMKSFGDLCYDLLLTEARTEDDRDRDANADGKPM